MIADLAIVGAGPAGITAAIVARALGLDPILLEAAARTGGQLHRVYSKLMGVLGIEGDGAALAAKMASELDDAGVPARVGAEALGLAIGAEGHPELLLRDLPPLAVRAVLIATGLRARSLGIAGEREFLGAGVSTSATRDSGRFAGKPVVVVGGGDAAYENALLLAAAGCRVTLVVRDATRAREGFRRRVADQPAIAVLPRTRVLAILGESSVACVRLAGPEGERVAEAAGVFIKIGSNPNTEWCGGAIARDTEGYLRVEARGATSMPGVWAAGDVARPEALTIAAAATSAHVAMDAIGEFLRRK